MREGKIILPNNDNGGKPLNAIQRGLTHELCKRFGGCTEIDGFGSWINGDGELIAEPVTVYTVAGEDNEQLRDIAQAYGRTAAQQAIYWTDFDGLAHVDNLETAPERQAA